MYDWNLKGNFLRCIINLKICNLLNGYNKLIVFDEYFIIFKLFKKWIDVECILVSYYIYVSIIFK